MSLNRHLKSEMRSLLAGRLAYCLFKSMPSDVLK
jgi:hypothetical protein